VDSTVFITFRHFSSLLWNLGLFGMLASFSGKTASALAALACSFVEKKEFVSFGRKCSCGFQPV
jgi:hypothetical protein